MESPHGVSMDSSLFAQVQVESNVNHYIYLQMYSRASNRQSLIQSCTMSSEVQKRACRIYINRPSKKQKPDIIVSSSSERAFHAMPCRSDLSLPCGQDSAATEKLACAVKTSFRMHRIEGFVLAVHDGKAKLTG